MCQILLTESKTMLEILLQIKRKYQDAKLVLVYSSEIKIVFFIILLKSLFYLKGGYLMNHLSQQERDSILDSLSEKQKEFVTGYLKRGRKTVFANVLAKDKAGLVQDVNHLQIAEQWELVDYIDAGPGWQQDAKYFCECGRPLRYQYIIENKELGQVKKFGIIHFQEHTGISPSLAREIIKGIESIDYEMDEILIKILNEWTLIQENIEEIPPSVIIPNDIQRHLDSDVPLLDRQVSRLKQTIATYFKEISKQRIEKEMFEEKKLEKERVAKQSKIKQELVNQIAYGTKISVNAKLNLEENLQIGVMTYLYNLSDPIVSADDVSKDLVAYHGASAKRFSSGTLKVYPNVCIYLEYLKNEGILEFVKKVGIEDRIYRVLELPELDGELFDDDVQMNLFENL